MRGNFQNPELLAVIDTFTKAIEADDFGLLHKLHDQHRRVGESNGTASFVVLQFVEELLKRRSA